MDILSLIGPGWIFFIVVIVAISIAAPIGGMILFGRLSKSMSGEGVTSGTSAPATILKTWDTGTTLNDNPYVGFQLDVHPANGPAFQVEMKQLVSRIQIGAFLPGAQVEVMYDPTNHKKIKIKEVLGMGGGMAGGMEGAVVSNGMVYTSADKVPQGLVARDQQLAAIRASGESAEATILNVMDMGIPLGDKASMKAITLQVHPTGRPDFQAMTQGAISTTANDKYQPGKTVWVKFNPNDMTQIALDHA